MQRKILFFIASLCFGLLFLVNCGKVTQEVTKSEKKEQKTFDLLFKVEMIPSSDVRLDFDSKLHKEESHLRIENELSLEDGKVVYVAVEGIKENEGLTMLSWGKMILQEKEVDVEAVVETEAVVTGDVTTLLETVSTENALVTENATVTENADVVAEETPTVEPDTINLESVAYNRHVLKITGSKYNDAYAKLLSPVTEHDLKKYKVDIKAIKLKYGFDGYIIKIFTDKNHYRIFSFDKETADEHNSYDKGTITLYETFLNTLYLMSLKENDYILERTTSPTVEMYERLYPKEFFELLETYQLPTNKEKKFKTTMPRFTLEREFEKELRMIMTHLLSTSKSDAKRYVDESKTLKLSRVAKRFLKSRIDAFILPEEEATKEDQVPKDDAPKEKEEAPKDVSNNTEEQVPVAQEKTAAQQVPSPNAVLSEEAKTD